MTREIKFREWSRGKYRSWEELGAFHMRVLNDGKGVFEQYTGIKDKNGADIYEGDVIQIPDDYETWGWNAGEVYQVVFQYGGFRLKPKYNKNARGHYLEDDREVILLGNIHENPELLEEE